MTYEEIVDIVRKVYEHADARQIFEHIAIEVDIVGEAAGAFYFEVAQRACVVEPYNYYDNDGVITTTADTLVQLAKGKLNVAKARELGLLRYDGDERKLMLCIDNIKLPINSRMPNK